MPGHGGIVHTTSGASNIATRAVTDANAYVPMLCPHCRDRVMAAVIAEVQEGAPPVTWFRCPSCHLGMVQNGQVIAPSSVAGEAVEGVPDDTANAYEEARRNASSASFTSCELMCRKILMHVAVDKGAETGKTFAFYLNHLATTGYLTPPMQPWVDFIRQRGNIATHELPASSKDEALGTLAFTAQLLKLVYEMDHKVRAFLPPPEAGD